MYVDFVNCLVLFFYMSSAYYFALFDYKVILPYDKIRRDVI